MKMITKIDAISSNNNIKKKRVGAYCRVSTSQEAQLVSLEVQRSHFEEYINSKPDWELVGLYYDEGISGTSKEKRPELLRMIADCEAGKLDYIVTKSLSRFSRNALDCLEIIRRLLNCNVPIYFEKENLDTGTMDGELILSIMSSLAESESKSMSSNIKWGIRNRFQNGSYRFSNAPFGYDIVDGDLAVNQKDAVYVKEVFSRFLVGESAGTIAKWLNHQGVLTQRSKKWTSEAIMSMLRNERYVGDCLLQKTYNDCSFSKKRNHGELAQYYIKDHHEAIIDQKTFDAVQELMERTASFNKVAPDKYHTRYPFSGLLRCGNCGALLKHRFNGSGDAAYPVWLCNSHKENCDLCPLKAVRDEAVSSAFVNMMNKLIFAREEVLVALSYSINRQMDEKSVRRISKIEDELDDITETRKTLNILASNGYLEPAMFSKETTELAAKGDELKREKEHILKNVGESISQTEALKDILEYTKSAETSTDFNGDLVGRFIKDATIISREEIKFHLKCGLNLTETMIQ